MLYKTSYGQKHCVLLKKESHTGLEWHESEMTFLWVAPTKQNHWQYGCVGIHRVPGCVQRWENARHMSKLKSSDKCGSLETDCHEQHTVCATTTSHTGLKGCHDSVFYPEIWSNRELERERERERERRRERDTGNDVVSMGMQECRFG